MIISIAVIEKISNGKRCPPRTAPEVSAVSLAASTAQGRQEEGTVKGSDKQLAHASPLMRKPPEQQLLKQQMLSQAARISEQLQRQCATHDHRTPGGRTSGRSPGTAWCLTSRGA